MEKFFLVSSNFGTGRMRREEFLWPLFVVVDDNNVVCSGVAVVAVCLMGCCSFGSRLVLLVLLCFLLF